MVKKAYARGVPMGGDVKAQGAGLARLFTVGDATRAVRPFATPASHEGLD